MEATSGSKKTGNVRNCVVNSRRSWTMYEEQSLINALKDIVSRGWKCENGFRTGYLGTLEQAMLQSFPGTDLKADPHIHSKIHVWKKQYGSLSTMLSRSGFGWNDAACTIDVLDELINTIMQCIILPIPTPPCLFQTDSNARNMRYKSWPYYKDWQVIFGKDRATGENAEEFIDALNDLAVNSKGKDNDCSADGSVPPTDASNQDNCSENISFSRADEATSGKSKSKSKSGNKRRRDDPVDSTLVDIMSSFIQKTEQQMSELVSRLGFEKDVSSARKKVFDALEPFDFLSFEERLNVTSRICDNTKDLDIFFSLSDSHKENMVRLILNGRY